MNAKDMTIEECGWQSVKHLFLNYHYLKSMPAGIMACYGLFSEGGFFCHGAAIFTNGRIQYENKFIEFARLWLVDDLQKNSESYFVSRCLKRLRKKFPSYEGVVTWADPEQGHDGAVYKAMNFVLDGESRKVPIYKGTNKGVIYQRSAKTGEQAPEVLRYQEPKKRYKYYFDPKERERRRNV